MEPSSSTSGAAAEPPPDRRRTCASCSRPAAVCLCHALPPLPIWTSTKILILQHPHEARHKLSTVPILNKCLQNSTTVVARRLRHGLTTLLDGGDDDNNLYLYLFPPTPSHPALNFSQIRPRSSEQPRWSEPRSRSSGPRSRSGGFVLIVFDGTWSHAREMVTASLGFLGSLGATRVCLDCDEAVAGGTMYDSELILRKEPFGGCVSTMEAVARCLGVMEVDGVGVEVEEALVRVLREMVRLQAGFVKTVKWRPRLLKKGKRREGGGDEDEAQNSDSGREDSVVVC